MPDRYDFESRGRNLVNSLDALASLCSGAEMLPSPDNLASTFAMLREQAERVYNDGMAFAFPGG